MARSKAYLFGGVEIRWSCDAAHLSENDQTPAKATLHFPGGLKDYLEASIEGYDRVTDGLFRRQGDKTRRSRHGRMGRCLVRRQGRLHQLLLQHGADHRRRHP